VNFKIRPTLNLNLNAIFACQFSACVYKTCVKYVHHIRYNGTRMKSSFRMKIFKEKKLQCVIFLVLFIL